MTHRTKPTHDPWKDIVRSRGTDQVELDEVLVQLDVGNRNARALKKALIARMAELARER